MRNRDDREFEVNVSDEAFGREQSKHSKMRFALRIVQEVRDSHDGTAIFLSPMQPHEKECLDKWEAMGLIKVTLYKEGGFSRGKEAPGKHNVAFAPEFLDMVLSAYRSEANKGASLPSIRGRQYKKRTEDREQHPAFGLITLHRQEGDRHLFGSTLKHNQAIVLTICRASRSWDLHRFWNTSEEQLVEIAMSQAQWGAFLSSMNVGGGTPVTLIHDENGKVEDCIYSPEVRGFKQEIGGAVKKIADALVRLQNLSDTLAEGKTITKAAFKELQAVIYKVTMDSKSNLPFLQESYEEAMAKTVDAAKREIESTIVNLTAQLGQTALKVLEERGQHILALPPAATEPAGKPLNHETLTAAVEELRTAQDEAGTPMNLTPKYAIVAMPGKDDPDLYDDDIFSKRHWNGGSPYEGIDG